MNTTAAKVLTQDSIGIIRREVFDFILPEIHFSVLIFFILMTALSLIYIKDLNRRLNIDLEQLANSSRHTQVDQNNLLLEQSAWSTEARVQQIAEQQLEMRIPSAAEVVMLRDAV